MSETRPSITDAGSLSELLRWLKLVHGSEVRKHLLEVLDSHAKRVAYEATDGSTSTRQIGNLAGVDQKTVSRWWRMWLEEGIVEPGSERPDRPAKLVSLRALGIL